MAAEGPIPSPAITEQQQCTSGLSLVQKGGRKVLDQWKTGWKQAATARLGEPQGQAKMGLLAEVGQGSYSPGVLADRLLT